MTEPDWEYVEEPESPPPEPPLTPPRVVVRFFLIPLLLVLAVLGTYLLLGFLFRAEKTPEELVRDLHSPYASTREHALYDLTYYIQRSPEKARRDPGLRAALLEAYRRRRDFRPDIRIYLAMALGYLAHPDALAVLREGLKDPDPNLVFYTVWALGKIGDPRAAAWIRPLLTHSDAGIREVSVITLGRLGDRESLPLLRERLHDTSASVRMNAVFALAAMGDPAALPGLRNLARRPFVEALPGMNPQKVESVLLNVIALAERYPQDEELQRRIAALRADPSFKVRNEVLRRRAR